MRVFFKKQTLVLVGVVLFILGFLLSFLLFRILLSNGNGQQTQLASGNSSEHSNCDVNAFRMSGFKYTQPLLYVEKGCESPEFLPIKTKVNELIAALKASGDIATVSVYLRDFEHSKWMGVHENYGFHPGSLTKLPLLLAYLRSAEKDATILDKEFVFEAPPEGTLPKQHYESASIRNGGKYSVRDLLRFMIVHSDNNATWLLNEKIALSDYNRTFLDLGVSIPLQDVSDGQVRISARDFSVFFRALYNSSYLAPFWSEYALSLLGESKFEQGFVKGLPEGMKMVHKFAEWDNGQDFELHESGILYIKKKAYLLTIMTQGKDRSKLPQTVASLTQMIYQFVAEP